MKKSKGCVERLRRRVDILTAERDEARALLEVPLRKMVFLCQDYPGDKEAAAWLERARKLLGGVDDQRRSNRAN